MPFRAGRPALAAAARENDGHPNDMQVTDPHGCSYRVCTRRRGEPLRPWEGAETGFGPLDLLVFVGSTGAKNADELKDV